MGLGVRRRSCGSVGGRALRASAWKMGGTTDEPAIEEAEEARSPPTPGGRMPISRRIAAQRCAKERARMRVGPLLCEVPKAG